MGWGGGNSMFAGMFLVEEPCKRRFGNPEISATSGKRITLEAICPYLRLAVFDLDREIKEGGW